MYNTCKHAYTHKCVHTCKHTHIYTYTCTYTHATQGVPLLPMLVPQVDMVRLLLPSHMRALQVCGLFSVLPPRATCTGGTGQCCASGPSAMSACPPPIFKQCRTRSICHTRTHLHEHPLSHTHTPIIPSLAGGYGASPPYAGPTGGYGAPPPPYAGPTGM
jgi:hypothetical protein